MYFSASPEVSLGDVLMFWCLLVMDNGGMRAGRGLTGLRIRTPPTERQKEVFKKPPVLVEKWKYLLIGKCSEKK